MKPSKENIQVVLIGVIFVAAIVCFWVWFLWEAITNEPEVFRHLGIWLGPIFAFPLLRVLARTSMSEEEKELDRKEIESDKGDAIASVMTVWFFGYPFFYLWVLS